MIKKEDIVEIGKFQKTHALKGELNALLDIEDDFVADGNPLIVEMDGIFVPFYGESIRPKGAESFLVKLRDIDTQEEAQTFVNKAIYGLRADLVEYFDDPDMELKEDFIGYKVVDADLGVLGEVKDVDDSTENVLLVIATENGEEVYVPIVEEFIREIDDDRQVIETRLPDGLVDLNRKKDE